MANKKRKADSMDAAGSSDTKDDSLADTAGVSPAHLQEKLGWARSFAEPN